MREPDWLGTPSVQNRSFTARGTPPSGVSAPIAAAPSLSFAPATQVKQFSPSPPPPRPAAPRARRQRARGRNRTARRRTAIRQRSPPRPARRTARGRQSCLGAGYQEPVSAGRGCLREDHLSRQTGTRLVGTQRAGYVDHVGCGRNLLEIEL